MPKKIPHLIFAGRELHEGDEIMEPSSGARGTVVLLTSEAHADDPWRVDYGNGYLYRLPSGEFEMLINLNVRVLTNKAVFVQYQQDGKAKDAAFLTWPDFIAWLAGEVGHHGSTLIGNETLADLYRQISGKPFHSSDCATSKAPAETPGPCDCDAPNA